MERTNKKVVVFDLWETLIFGTEDSAISIFYQGITGEDISPEQLKKCMLIKESEPKQFLERFLEIVTPSNMSSMLLSLKNPRSSLREKIILKFNEAIEHDFKEIRWVPGAIELLSILKEKYTLIVVSNLWAYQKSLLFERLGINKYFKKCLLSCDTGVEKNDMLKNLPGMLGIDTWNTVYVGRSYEFDIIPAVNANISAIRITNENNIIFPEKLVRMIEEELDGKATYAAKKYTVSKKEKRDFLIVIPPFYKLLGSHNNRLNLSATYISAYLSSQGYSNKIYHCDSEPHENYVTRYQMVFNSIDFYDALAKDKAFEEFEGYYGEHRADTVLVTCGDILNPSVDSGNWDSSNKIAKTVRKINPNAFIVAIGPETGSQSKDFDLIVNGEVETLLPHIIGKKIRGKVAGSLLSESELKAFPAFDFENIATKISPPSLDTVMWRRGCSGTCDFCRVAEVNKGTIRYRSTESVLSDIRARYDRFNMRNFYIVDANFTLHKETVIEFCKRIRKEFSDINWRVESRFDTLDSELIKEMKDAGCTHLKLGLENALNEKHQVKTKRVSLDNASDWIKEVRNAGIKCVIYLMLGGKWFTYKQYEEMYENTKALNADGYTVSLFNPYPNTPAGLTYEEWRKRGFIGSHLDIRLVDFWKIPIDIVDAFFSLELEKGREDKNIRKFLE